MNMCASASACVCVCVPARAHVYALRSRIISMDKIVCFTNSLIIIIIMTSTEYIQFHNQ